MPPAILSLTVFSTMLLSSSNAAPLPENSARVLKAEPATPGLSILVTLDVNGQSGPSYEMVARPKYFEDKSKVLFDVSARFDQGSPVPGIDKSVISYKQTDGYAIVVIPSNGEKPATCLTTESSTEKETYMIPPLNAIFEGIMAIANEFGSLSTPDCAAGHGISAEGGVYFVCETRLGQEITIEGNSMLLNVTYHEDVTEINNGGKESGCLQVAKPYEVKGSLGNTLLNLSP